MDSSAAREQNQSQATSLPEEWFNITILCMAFAYKLMNLMGTLATIWATVVLLGGFSTKIKRRDFWYVTIIGFIQIIGILGGYEDPAHQIFMRAPEALRKNKRAAELERKMSWWRRRRITEEPQQQTGRAQRRKKDREAEEEKRATNQCRTVLGTAILYAWSLGQVAAVATCMALTSRRLRAQDYVDRPNRDNEEYRNIGRSLNIFYGLVLAQGIIFICMRLNPLLLCLKLHVKAMYRLFSPSGENILHRYKNDNYLEFITGNVRATLNTDLITFAKKVAVSDSIDDQLDGIRAMDRILRSVQYSSLALFKLQASLDADASGKLVDMLGLMRNKDEEAIRGHATRVVLKLAPDLLVESFPQIIQLISSSLLSTVNSKKMDVDLVWFGLRILDKLITENPDNCRQTIHAGDLLSKIIYLTNLRGHGSPISASWIEEEIIPVLEREDDIPPPSIQKIEREIIVGMSLNILSKLVATPDDAGKKLRDKISQSVRLLSNTGMILEHVEATRVIACLALDKTAREDIGRSPEIIKKLKDCLLSKTPHVNITKVAAKLLLLEYTEVEQLTQIQSFIAEKHILEDQGLLLPVSAIIEELELKLWMPRAVQDLDLEDLLKARRVNLSEAAAEALVLLTTGCEENVAAVLEEINLQELQMAVNMLSSENGEKSRRMSARLEGYILHPEISRIIKKILCAEDGEHRSMSAKLLKNLRAYSSVNKFNQHMQVIDEALPKVLKQIVDEVAKLEETASTNRNQADEKDDLPIKEGKVLESFIGLAVQICTSLNPCDFARTLEGANLTVGAFVQKLKKILEVYKSPTTDFPGIRRSTVQLMARMIQINSNYIEIFLQCGLYDQLNEVANTARTLESFELFCSGVGVAQHTTSVSSLAKELQAQIFLSPNFQERFHCSGAHADTITVLVA